MTNIGTLVMMKIGTLILVGESTTSFKSAQAMIEISNKTSGNVAAFVGGRITQTMNVHCLYQPCRFRLWLCRCTGSTGSRNAGSGNNYRIY